MVELELQGETGPMCPPGTVNNFGLHSKAIKWS